MLIKENSRLVMIGDSITDCDRQRPLGEGLFGAIGKGYAGFISGLLQASYPERKIRVTNMGVAGNTVRDLKQRWETDVLALKPDWLSIMIGTNDVWRQFDLPAYKEYHVGLEEYSETLEELVRDTLPHLKGLVLMAPFFIEKSKEDEMRRMMDQYGAVVKRLACKYDTVFVDTQAAFDEQLKTFYSAAISWDRVHPNIEGHMVLARAFLNSIGYQW